MRVELILILLLRSVGTLCLKNVKKHCVPTERRNLWKLFITHIWFLWNPF